MQSVDTYFLTFEKIALTFAKNLTMRSNANKNIIYSIILLLLVAVVYLYRQNQNKPEEETVELATGKVVLTGSTMGTSYRIVYLDMAERDFKKEIDSVLVDFNQSMSTYIKTSEISQFNQTDTLYFKSGYFLPILEESKTIHEITAGAFDPTVGPLTDLWGFGPKGPQLRDSVNIDNMLQYVNFDLISFDQEKAWKPMNEMHLDFSAIAKGYGVDVIVSYLESVGIENMLVEIGGELVARGVNENGELWKVGVSTPTEGIDSEELFGIIALDNRGMATSGNYRNYYEVDGLKISHTINPKTGRPVRHNLLSATVLAENCMRADALATAIMVMGKEEAIALQAKSNFEFYLIYSDESGEIKSHASEGIKPFLSFSLN